MDEKSAAAAKYSAIFVAEITTCNKLWGQIKLRRRRHKKEPQAVYALGVHRVCCLNLDFSGWARVSGDGMPPSRVYSRLSSA